MKGFFIDISNGLLDPKHVLAMGEKSAVWVFMWCLDKVTRVDEHEIGWVRGGKPINLQDIAEELGVHPVTVSNHLTKLENEQYIFRVHTAYGIIITVAKAKKRFSRSAKARISASAKPNTYKDNNSIPWTKDLLMKLEEKRGTKIITVGPQVQALGKLGKAGLSPAVIWEKLLELENLSDWWKENPPDFVNLARNFHRLRGQKSRYHKIIPQRPRA